MAAALVVLERIESVQGRKADAEVLAAGCTRLLYSDGQAWGLRDAETERWEVREQQRKGWLEPVQARYCVVIEKLSVAEEIEELGRTEVYFLTVVASAEPDREAPMGRIEVAAVTAVDTGYMVVKPWT